MPPTAADVLIETIHHWGVEVIFGKPGESVAGILEALEKKSGDIRFISVRHEESAALMACAYAKFTGKLGACLATSGQGGIHMLSGLYDAKLDGQPVLALTGTQIRDLTDTFGQQDVALDRVFMDLAIYNTRIMGPAHAENVADLACRSAISQRGVAHIAFPIDIQSREIPKETTRTRRLFHSDSVFAQRARLPYEGDLRQAAEILNGGEKIAILAGRGAQSATAELELVSELLGAPITKAFLGKAAVPDDSPYTTGILGPFGTRPSLQAIQNCDTLLIVGTSFPYTDFLPKRGCARAIQIDIDPTRIGLRYPIEVGLVGDCQRTLKVLLPLLEHHQDRSFLEKTQENTIKWKKEIAKIGESKEGPVKPQEVVWELGKLLPDNAILSCDPGDIAAWWSRFIPARAGQMHAISGNLASSGCALPYTMAGQVAYPDRLCVALSSEEGFSALMSDFISAVKYQLPVKIVLLRNAASQATLERIDFASYARACGAQGVTIDNREDCAPILEKVLQATGPILVEANIDPCESPEVIKPR
jgi:pyruvate dehydrogenase (quinone)